MCSDYFDNSIEIKDGYCGNLKIQKKVIPTTLTDEEESIC